MALSTHSKQARRLAAALEPCIGQVYFAPEAHAAYEQLGFNASPASFDGLAMPDGAAYFTSRGSLMGKVSPSVVAAAFAVFNPEAVVPAVAYGWSLTDDAIIRARRREGGAAQLERVVADADASRVRAIADSLARALEPLTPEGRPLFAGARDHLGEAGSHDAWLHFFEVGDALREYRGDSHTASWVSAGVGATEIGLVSEAYMGLPPRTYSRSRAWSDAQFDAAADRARSRGWFDAAGALTDEGRAAREAIEVATDHQLVPALRALGDELDDLLATLEPWGAAMRAAHGYPGGPGDLWPNR
ncbi:MAG TPA: hypothetical protein VGO03_01445 [Acidimicrobiia bacterium]|jgi:hypothetical protein